MCRVEEGGVAGRVERWERVPVTVKGRVRERASRGGAREGRRAGRALICVGKE